jgi:hypothetical protein
LLEVGSACCDGIKQSSYAKLASPFALFCSSLGHPVSVGIEWLYCEHAPELIDLLQSGIIQEFTGLPDSDMRYVIAKQHAIRPNRLEMLSLEDIRHLCRQIIQQHSPSKVRKLLTSSSCSYKHCLHFFRVPCCLCR